MNESYLLPTLWLQSIYWRQPLWLLLALQPFMLLLIRQIFSKRKLSCYADANLQAWVIWQQTKKSHPLSSWIISRQAAYIIAWLLLAISLSGPRLLLEQPAGAAITDEPDLNIMIVVDVSRSMLARDIEPNRLRRVQIEINELLQRASNNRVGLILYTARAHLLVPFTRDVNAFKYYLKLMDNIPLPTYGSSPSSALDLARKEIEQANFQSRSAILWFTDGDFTDDTYTDNDFAYNKSDEVKKITATVKNLSNKSIALFILGMGSIEGEAVPLTEGGWLQFEGRPVISRMNEKFLTELAETANGRFIITQNDDSDWQTLYDRGMAANSHLANRPVIDNEVVWQELYPWTLLPAILLLFACLMPYRLKSMNSVTIMLVSKLLLFSLIPSLNPFNQAHAAERTAQEITEIERLAYHRFKAKNFDQAAEFYRQLPGYNGRLGEGSSYYRKGEYKQAIAQFNQAVVLAEMDQLRANAIYNLANATFKTGDYAAAAALFKDVLLYRPWHKAAKINLAISDYLQQLIEEQIKEGTAIRMGSGPRSTRAQQGLDINDRGSMSFDNEEQRLKADIPLPEIPAEELEKLLAKGLAHVRLVNEEPAGLASEQQHNGQWQQDITAARIRMRELEDRQQLLWKRLFEMEEGFAAPVEQAETVPGVLPW
jgi:Ca-activated chloride channel family protein